MSSIESEYPYPENSRILAELLTDVTSEEREVIMPAGEDVYQAFGLLHQHRMQTPEGQAFRIRVRQNIEDHRELLDSLDD